MRTETDAVFSLVIPSRGRTAFLRDCLDSFFDKAKNPHLVEAVVVLDYDDPESIAMMTGYGDAAKRNLLTAIRQRNRHIIKYYHNYGAQCSSGRYVWILNDECLIENPHWDEMLLPRIERFLSDKPDRLLYVVVDDDTHARQGALETQGCCFPIVSRETVDVQNGIFPPELWMWGADIDLYRIFTGLPESRILRATDVKVLHRSYHNETQPVDQTQADVMRCEENRLSPEGLQEYIRRLGRRLRTPPESAVPRPPSESLVNKLPRLLEDSYCGFNIVWYDGAVYGVRHGTFPFDEDKAARTPEAGYLAGASVEEVKRLIDRLPPPADPSGAAVPRLLEEGYGGVQPIVFGTRLLRCLRSPPGRRSVSGGHGGQAP